MLPAISVLTFLAIAAIGVLTFLVVAAIMIVRDAGSLMSIFLAIGLANLAIVLAYLAAAVVSRLRV